MGLDIERQLLLAQRAYPIRSRFRANHLASAIECETDNNYSGRAFPLVTEVGRQRPIFFVCLVHDVNPNTGQERQMPSSRNLLVIGATAITAVLGIAPVSVAQAPPQGSVDELTNHEGVFLDAKSGKIAKAKAKNEDWIQIAKSKAVELGEGAVIFRWGDKLYLIEGDPNAPIRP